MSENQSQNKEICPHPSWTMKKGQDHYACDMGCGATISREMAEKSKYKNLKEVLTDKQFNDMLYSNGGFHKKKAKLVHFIWNYAKEKHVEKILEIFDIEV